MDMWVHFLVGIIIQSFIFSNLPVTPLSWILVLLLAFLSHFIVDWGSYITFHPDETYMQRHPHDKFNKIRLVLSTIYPIITIIYFALITEINYLPVMFASWAVDFIDWIVLRGLIKRGKVDEKYNHNGILHPIINKLRETLLPFWPNWREKKWAYAIEYCITVPLAITAVILTL